MDNDSRIDKLELKVKRLERMIGSLPKSNSMPFFYVNNIVELYKIIVTPPAAAYVAAEGKYYFYYEARGFGEAEGELNEYGMIVGGAPNKWIEIGGTSGIIRFNRRSDLLDSKIPPPALAFVEETSRYYVRVGAEGIPYAQTGASSQKKNNKGEYLWYDEEGNETTDINKAVAPIYVERTPDKWLLISHLFDRNFSS